MTGEEATEFAARITAEIGTPGWELSDDRLDADLRRVARDLAGYQLALDGLSGHWMEDGVCWCRMYPECLDGPMHVAYRDAYMEALTETGALYGVTL